MGRPSLAIVIPVFNEEKTIGRIVDDIQIYGDVIIIDDKSNDNTFQKLKNKRITLHRNHTNFGYERSLYKGIRIALEKNYEIIITFDGDGQHPFKMIPYFEKLILEGADIVVGNRQKKQRFSEYLYSFVFSNLFNISDPLCGMKAFKSKILYEKEIPQYKSIGTEILVYGLAMKKKIIEIDIITSNRIDQSRFGQKFVHDVVILKSFFLGMVFFVYWRIIKLFSL